MSRFGVICDGGGLEPMRDLITELMLGDAGMPLRKIRRPVSACTADEKGRSSPR
jgi:hypothetical protein